MSSPKVRYLKVDADDEGIRLDNYLIKHTKGVPKTRIYKAIRSGEVRLDKKRAKPTNRLCQGMMIRIPPLHESTVKVSLHNMPRMPHEWILHEDDYIIALNKPDDIPVHAGSKQNWGIVDLASAYIDKKCYLVHRLDKAVSGIVVLTKTRQGCNEVIKHWHNQSCNKHYQALVFGELTAKKTIDKPLAEKQSNNKTKPKLQAAITSIKPIASTRSYSYIAVDIATGRYHQIRRHLADSNLPLVGDIRYGDFKKNRIFTDEHGVKGLFLHAAKLTFWHPEGYWFTLKAKWPEDKQNWLKSNYNIDI